MAEVISTMVQVHVAKDSGAGNWLHLVLRRSPDQKIFPSLWQVITGKTHGSETAVQAAIRELIEETGLSHDRLWTLPYVSTFYSVRRDAVVAVPVFACTVPSDAVVILSHEHDSHEWLDHKSCIERLVIPAQQHALTLFHEVLTHRLSDSEFSEVYEIDE